MKKIILTLSLLFFSLFGYSQEQSNNYAVFKGQIKNPINETLMVASQGRNGFREIIHLKPDGSFIDTIKLPVNDIDFFITHGDNQNNLFSMLYLKKGFKLTLNADITTKTMQYSGDGSVENNFFVAYREKQMQEMKELSKSVPLYGDDLAKSIKESSNKDIELLNQYKENMDPAFYNKQHEAFNGRLDNELKRISENTAKRQSLFADLSKGTPSPKFTNYENVKGGLSSLDNFKGKYVFIDIWATWCSPCRAEIPFLKQLEKEYENKNIVFISISVDDLEDKDTWKKMIKENKMGGIQLHAPKGREDKFIKEYKLAGIPRFIIIDKDGNIFHADAPKPSDPELKKLLSSINL
ncbi:TlpA family protein disulfide reductase [Pedobacter sp. MW01-1-1]|uniref:TlpA family protein disulfide reductase n=1 Tax=Pedobacter sp. MW01-1-1 TaxID=3383027 RepID=UPI003FF0389E